MKKEGFHWNPKVEEAFLRLKKAIGDVPKLAPPNVIKGAPRLKAQLGRLKAFQAGADLQGTP